MNISWRRAGLLSGALPAVAVTMTGVASAAPNAQRGVTCNADQSAGSRVIFSGPYVQALGVVKCSGDAYIDLRVELSEKRRPLTTRATSRDSCSKAGSCSAETVKVRWTPGVWYCVGVAAAYKSSKNGAVTGIPYGMKNPDLPTACKVHL